MRKNILLLTLIALLFLVGICGVIIFKGDGLSQRSFIRHFQAINDATAWPYWNNVQCSQTFGLEPCQISTDLQQVRLMILGDSHGNQLYPGLAQNFQAGVLSSGQCPPLFGVQVGLERDQGKSLCTPPNTLEKNLTILSANPQIHTVLLTAFWTPLLNLQFVAKRERQNLGPLQLWSGAYGSTENPQELVFLGLKKTLGALGQLNKRVVIVRDTPYIEDDFRDFCLQRRQIVRSKNLNCTIPKEKVLSNRRLEDALIAKLKIEDPNLQVFDPLESLCDAENCYIIKNGIPLFRDAHHLSVQGSLLLGQALKQKFPALASSQ